MDEDGSAQRRETYRLAHHDFNAAVAGCDAVKSTLKRITAVLDRIDPAPINTGTQARDTVPVIPPVAKAAWGATPTEADILAAIDARNITRAALINAWNAMSKDEKADCASPPKTLYLSGL